MSLPVKKKYLTYGRKWNLTGTAYKFCPICLKFGVEHLCAFSMSRCDFRENQRSESCTLLWGINGFLSVLSILSDCVKFGVRDLNSRDSFPTPALTCGKLYNTVVKVHSVSEFHFKLDTL